MTYSCLHYFMSEGKEETLIIPGNQTTLDLRDLSVGVSYGVSVSALVGEIEGETVTAYIKPGERSRKRMSDMSACWLCGSGVANTSFDVWVDCSPLKKEKKNRFKKRLSANPHTRREVRHLQTVQLNTLWCLLQCTCPIRAPLFCSRYRLEFFFLLNFRKQSLWLLTMDVAVNVLYFSWVA